MKTLVLPLLALVTLVLPACVPYNRPLSAVGHVNLNRFSGAWHEIAHSPNPWERAGDRTTVEYTPAGDGRLNVLITAEHPNDKTTHIRGTAVPIPGSGNARMNLEFHGPAGFKNLLKPADYDGNYWIIELDPGYRYAAIGSPDHKYLWFLARRPHLDHVTDSLLRSRAAVQGYRTEELIYSGEASPRY